MYYDFVLQSCIVFNPVPYSITKHVVKKYEKIRLPYCVKMCHNHFSNIGGEKRKERQ